MSTHVFEAAPPAPVEETPAPARGTAPAPLDELDLFALGRRAADARGAHLGRRGSFVRTRQLVAGGEWRGPRDAALGYVDEADLDAAGGVSAAASAGAGLLVASQDVALVEPARAAGLLVVWRIPFSNGEPDAARTARLDALAAVAPQVWGLCPTPAGEPYGLDALRMFALCRLARPEVPHLLSDVAALGPRLAQMAFGFGADELWGPIVAERALRLGANANNPALTRREAATLIRGAGLTPCERLANGELEEVTP